MQCLAIRDIGVISWSCIAREGVSNDALLVPATMFDARCVARFAVQCPSDHDWTQLCAAIYARCMDYHRSASSRLMCRVADAMLGDNASDGDITDADLGKALVLVRALMERMKQVPGSVDSLP